MKAQTTLVALVLIIAVFSGLMLFLFSTAQKSAGTDYGRLYTANLLSVVLNADTGYAENIDLCKTVEDLVYCAETTPEFRCGSRRCGDDSKGLIDLYISKTLDTDKFDYFLKYGERELGNKAAAKAKNKWESQRSIVKRGSVIEVKLIVAEK